jgi:hypothetical protein
MSASTFNAGACHPADLSDGTGELVNTNLTHRFVLKRNRLVIGTINRASLDPSTDKVKLLVITSKYKCVYVLIFICVQGRVIAVYPYGVGYTHMKLVYQTFRGRRYHVLKDIHTLPPEMEVFDNKSEGLSAVVKAGFDKYTNLLGDDEDTDALTCWALVMLFLKYQNESKKLVQTKAESYWSNTIIQQMLQLINTSFKKKDFSRLPICTARMKDSMKYDPPPLFFCVFVCTLQRWRKPSMKFH